MKKGIHFLSVLLLISLLFSGIPFYMASATDMNNSGENGESAGDTGTSDNNEGTGDERSQSTEEGSDTIPESYYLPIESNNIKDWPKGEQIEADAAVVMDASTGAILYSKNMDAREYPASITKIMTTMLALEHGKLNDVITFSEEAVYSIEPGSTHLGIKPGEQLTLRQSLYGVMMASANEIANGVAEHIGGSIENFVQMMNDKAAALGCTNTHFVNPNGLHDENHYTSARDMALIMQEAIKNKMFCKIIKTKEYNYPKTNITDEVRYFLNHHQMLFSDEPEYYCDCLGGKTGFTDDALNTLVSYAKKDGRKLISVILRVNGAPKAYDETARLFQYGFDNFSQVEKVNSQKDQNVSDILGIGYLGELRKFQKPELMELLIHIEPQTRIVLPKGGDIGSVKRQVDLNQNQLTYTYHGWNVGSTKIKLNPIFTSTQKGPEFRTQTEVTEVQESQSEAIDGSKEDSVGTTANIKGSVASMWNAVTHVFVSTYEKVDLFIRDNTAESAVLGGILLLIFVPLLIIAVSRNYRYKRIQKERNHEEELRRQLEDELNRKTLQEIEDEIRATEEKVRASEQRAMEREIAAANEARQLEEVEQILAGEQPQGDLEWTSEVEDN